MENIAKTSFFLQKELKKFLARERGGAERRKERRGQPAQKRRISRGGKGRKGADERKKEKERQREKSEHFCRGEVAATSQARHSALVATWKVLPSELVFDKQGWIGQGGHTDICAGEVSSCP